MGTTSKLILLVRANYDAGLISFAQYRKMLDTIDELANAREAFEQAFTAATKLERQYYDTLDNFTSRLNKEVL
jgi:hypothetical protein